MEIFEESVRPSVLAALDGYNVAVFAMGRLAREKHTQWKVNERSIYLALFLEVCILFLRFYCRPLGRSIGTSVYSFEFIKSNSQICLHQMNCEIPYRRA